jgi:hypothetical protein
VDKNAYLIQLSESEQTDFGRTEFAAQPPDQQVFSAIWVLESGVNSDGFSGYFSSWDGDTTNFAPEALERIGAPNAAAIVRRALQAVSVTPLPSDHDQREALVLDLDDAKSDALEAFDSEFFAYPDNLTECLFAFVAARPETFGPTPSE